MKKILVPLFILVCFITNAQISKIKVIYVQPLGDVNPEYVKVVKQSVELFYGFTCVIKPKLDLTRDLLATSYTRYEASKILSKFKSNENLLILTQKDIACVNKERNSAEWGIFGLGYRPGTTCVVSTFRMHSKGSQSIFYSRLKKVCLHEIGHNLGLNHCTYDRQCMMNDANGTIKQVDNEKIWFCNNCKKQLKLK